jgi:hypothetical protein
MFEMPAGATNMIGVQTGRRMVGHFWALVGSVLLQ